MKLLIAEDDLTSRTMLATVTRKWGYEPVAVEDGEAAWQVLQEPDSPRLLLIDREMPQLDGLGLCQRIRRQAGNNPPFIIVLTARSETDDIVAGLQAGANDYIAKPFAIAELQARLQVGQRMLDLQRELNQTREVLTHEREVVEDIILKMRASKRFEDAQLRQLHASVEKTSGDLLLSADRPDKTRHIMLGDFTGHGLTAAVGGPIVNDIFYSMTAKGLAMHDIIGEVNRRLLEKMPTGLFMGAIFIQQCPDKHSLLVWNCGMPDVLIYRKDTLWKKISSSTVALGIIDQAFESYSTIKVEAGDHVYAYSDGITEAVNIAGEAFGQSRLEGAISELLATHAEIGFICNTIGRFRGETNQADDVTLVELAC